VVQHPQIMLKVYHIGISALLYHITAKDMKYFK